MTEPTAGHAQLDQLAAGYALHALDPADESRFAAHLPHCRRCQGTVDSYAEVTAALAETGLDDQPSSQLRDRVLGAMTAARAPGDDPGVARHPAVPARRRGTAGRRRMPGPRMLLAAAAAVVVVAGGAAAGEILTAPGAASQPPSAGCAAAGQCQELTLADARTRLPAATVIVTGGVAWLLTARLPADQPSRQVYVLWQLSGSRAARAVGAFDVAGRSRHPVRIGSLRLPYRMTTAFAVSLERGRAIPPAPSVPVALGAVPPAARQQTR